MRIRRLLVPEVVQTSATDCGPACLKSLLEGFGIPVNYDRLREACQTDVDGTSINSIEQVAVQLGLDAEQVMIPSDHLLQSEARALPALVVVRLPNAFAHFVIVWGSYGGVLQVMDPAHGRQWPMGRSFLEQVYVHAHMVPGADWREWAASDEFVKTLRHRAQSIGVSASAMSKMIASALADPAWRPIASLDAAVRMVRPMVDSGGLSGASATTRVLERFFERARSTPETPFEVIPPDYWSALPVGGSAESDEEQIVFRGAVLVRVRGRRKDAAMVALPASASDSETTETIAVPSAESQISQSSPTPGVGQLIRFLRADGLLAPAALVTALLAAAIGVVFEAIAFRTFLDLTGMLGLTPQRLSAAAMLIGFVGALLVLDLLIAGGLLGLGRRLEARVRMHLLRVMPRLSDRYFGSRLVSDMAERSHAIHDVRTLPILGGQLMSPTFQLILTTAGIIWLDPFTAPLAILGALFAVVLPLALEPVVAERDLRFRTHTGGLCRFYYDSLCGLMPVRAHGAEDAVRCEHEALLVSWSKAGLSMQRTAVVLEAFSGLFGLGLTSWLLLSHIARNADTSVGLLLIYWALNIPALGRQVAQAALMYPRLRNLSLRLLEPLAAVNDVEEDSRSAPVSEAAYGGRAARHSVPGVAIQFQDVSVRAMGQTILQEFRLEIEPGSHVCIVGPSGAGKSSLVGLLLGWHRPATGTILIDGEPLDDERLESLRRETAWVDPSVQIWNRSLLENLQYGMPSDSGPPPIGDVIEQANLLPVLEKLPDGLQTRLGESGALVSGGEGQRVRLGRAMLRPSPRLVILDEPFTALDRAQRETFLGRCRELWQSATVLFITHDIAASKDFQRVIVLERGQIAGDGRPEILMQDDDSPYRRLLESEETVRERTWADHGWRRLHLEHGRIEQSSERREHDKQFRGDVLASRENRRSAGSLGAKSVTSHKVN